MSLCENCVHYDTNYDEELMEIEEFGYCEKINKFTLPFSTCDYHTPVESSIDECDVIDHPSQKYMEFNNEQKMG